MLRRALIVLSLPAEAQLDQLRELGGPEYIDELALEYDDIAAAAGGMFMDGELSEEQSDAALQLNEYLGSISGAHNGHRWTAAALESSEEWRTVRRMAAEALRLFGTTPGD